jgi:hypothetical protein
MDERERAARMAVRKARKNLPDLFSKQGNRRLFRAVLEQQDVNFLLAATRKATRTRWISCASMAAVPGAPG